MNKRITELDGVRAIAVGLVFFNHFAPVASVPWLDVVHRIGWVGVDVFFVLSGFLVTGILLEVPGDQEGYYTNFYARRSLRIFPLYYGVLTASLFYMFIRNGGQELRDMNTLWGNPAWLYAYLGNMKAAVTNVTPPSYFAPMWSLHVEEQFYLIFPFLVRRLTRAQLVRTLVAAVILAPMIRLMLLWQYPGLPLLQYMLFPCRMDALALGGLVAVYRPDSDAIARWKLPLTSTSLGLLVLAITVFQVAGGRFDASLERTIGYSLFDFAFVGFLILILGLRGGPMTAWLNTRPFQYVGMISYGLYLFQTPAESLANKLVTALGVPGAALGDTVFEFVLVGTTCLALSTLSWYCWETKWLLLKARFVGGRSVGLSTLTQEAVSQASAAS